MARFEIGIYIYTPVRVCVYDIKKKNVCIDKCFSHDLTVTYMSK